MHALFAGGIWGRRVCCQILKFAFACLGDDIDGQGRQAGRSITHRETCNPIYEGAVYETTPGESLTCLISPSSALDSTHCYVKQPPSLPPPRDQGTAEPLDEIDAIKASLMQGVEWPKSESGDVYVVMGPNSTTPGGSVPNQLKLTTREDCEQTPFQ